MAVENILVTETLVAVTCGECGIVFGMTDSFRDARIADHKVFYCPNGHPRVYNGESEADRLRRHLEWERTRASSLRDSLDATERRARSYKGHVTRIKNRVKNGTCPCCTRHFTNLERHMKTEHPTWQPIEGQ